MRSSPEGHTHLWGVVLAGGIGSRFWPASTPARPKQLLPLASDLPLIRETIERVLPLIPIERIRVLTGQQLGARIRELMPELVGDNFLIEPRAAGTAPILTWAAAVIARADPEAVIVSMHSDHRILPSEAFRARIGEVARLADEHRRLFTLGAVPERPETGYGYIQVGSSLVDEPEPIGFRVAEFVEKPDLETARRYLATGRHLWNTGIFVWRADTMLDEVRRHTPEIAELIPCLERGDVAGFFRGVPTLSIDQGLLERSGRVAVAPANFEWDDIGSWDALFRTRAADADGNVAIGDAVAVECQDSALYAEEGPVVAFGVRDLVIVRASGVTFVTHRERTGELKRLLEQLPPGLRTPD